MKRAWKIAKKLLNGIVEQRMATAARVVDQHKPYAEFLLQPNRAGKTTPANHVDIQPSDTVAEEPHGHLEMATPEKCPGPSGNRTTAVEV